MNKLKVKKESLAKRCEICHQKDSFDEVVNYCFRCKEVETLVKPIIKNNKPIRVNPKEKGEKKLKTKIVEVLRSNVYLFAKVLLSSFFTGAIAKVVFEINFNLSSNLLEWQYKELVKLGCIFGSGGLFTGYSVALLLKLAFLIKTVKYKFIYGTILGLFFGYFVGSGFKISLCFIDKNIVDYIRLCDSLFSMLIGLITGLVVSFDYENK